MGGDPEIRIREIQFFEIQKKIFFGFYGLPLTLGLTPDGPEIQIRKIWKIQIRNLFKKFKFGEINYLNR